MAEFFSELLQNAVIFTIIGATLGFALAPVPAKFFKHDCFFFQSFPFEQNGAFYEKYFKITRWKDKLPEFSEIVKVGFCKDSLNSLSKTYLDRFLTETMRAEFCHVLLILLSPIYFLFDETPWAVTMLIFTVIANIPFIMIQRYNRPRIARLLAQIEKRNARIPN